MLFLLRNLLFFEDNVKMKYFVELTGFSCFSWIKCNSNKQFILLGFVMFWGVGRARTCKFVKQ